ncbi:hypothetical protein ACPB9J_31630 [Streptomyces lavendulocolor]|uniref:hypothetical protein n=1 Tax=Streptomyces lavendulocolor TaxID=67316 RepID=UPI003C2BB11F
MPKHARGRRPRIVFVEPAETQLRTLTTVQAARLDTALGVIGADPDAVKPHATAPACTTTSTTGCGSSSTRRRSAAS